MFALVLALARKAFIPHLAQVNAAGQFVRRVATLDEIAAEARPLIDRFADQRLLIRDRRKDVDGKGVDVVEVAHEALLRQPPFSDWLKEDREFLVWRERLGQARAAFEANQRGLLAGRELAIARGFVQTRAEREIAPADQAFIRESIAEDDKRQAAEKVELERRIQEAERIAAEQKRTARRAWVLAAIALVFSVWAIWQSHVANEQREVALQATQMANKERDNAVKATQTATNARNETDILLARAKAMVGLLQFQMNDEAHKQAFAMFIDAANEGDAESLDYVDRRV
jgi:hypothetical protein